jgi:hypothetical protein
MSYVKEDEYKRFPFLQYDKINLSFSTELKVLIVPISFLLPKTQIIYTLCLFNFPILQSFEIFLKIIFQANLSIVILYSLVHGFSIGVPWASLKGNRRCSMVPLSFHIFYFYHFYSLAGGFYLQR